jgi:hypothetical protein
MAVSSGDAVQEGDDDESDDGECGGGDHGGSLGVLRVMSAFATVAPDRPSWRQVWKAAERRGVVRDRAEGSVDCMKIRR